MSNFYDLKDEYLNYFNNNETIANLMALVDPNCNMTLEEFATIPMNGSGKSKKTKKDKQPKSVTFDVTPKVEKFTDFCENDFCILKFDDSSDNVFAIDHLANKFSFATDKHPRSKCLGKQLQGSFKLLPNFKSWRDVIYISGPSGAGKTYWAKDFALSYKCLHPKNKVYALSNKPILHDSINIQMLPIDQPKNINNYKNSLIIFDDIENISSNKTYQDECIKFLEECLNVGRSLYISCIVISHVIMNYRLTRNIIMEARYIIIFPMSGLTYQYRNFLSKYVGLDKKQINDILKIKKRWVIIHKHCPISIITDESIQCL